MDILGIKTIDDVDVDGIINELESNGFSQQKVDGFYIWEGTLSDGTEATIKKNGGGELFSVMLINGLSGYLHQDGYDVWQQKNEDGEVIFRRDKNKTKDRVEKREYHPVLNKITHESEYVDGDLVKEKSFEYNDKGQLVSTKTKHRDSISDYTSDYIYNESGVLTKRITKTTLSTKEELFDSNGNVVEKNTTAKNGEKSKDIFEYDDNGKLIYHELYTKLNYKDFKYFEDIIPRKPIIKLDKRNKHR